jgi:hypothetical protein
MVHMFLDLEKGKQFTSLPVTLEWPHQGSFETVVGSPGSIPGFVELIFSGMLPS